LHRARNKGVQIAGLNTTYFLTPGFFLFNDHVANIQSTIATNLQNCAGTGLFQTVAPGDDIGAAFVTLFQAATASPHLTHSWQRLAPFEEDVRRAQRASVTRAFSVPMESERKLYVFVLTHFLHASRRPFRSKML
jgi:hypothetical protein